MSEESKPYALSTSTYTPEIRPSSVVTTPLHQRGDGDQVQHTEQPYETKEQSARAIALAPGSPVWSANTPRDRVQKAANGKSRCRLHGGALGSGAPSGTRNGNYRHGRHTKEAIAERQFMRALLRQSRELSKRAEAPMHELVR